jgi:hypothetical protein
MLEFLANQMLYFTPLPLFDRFFVTLHGDLLTFATDLFVIIRGTMLYRPLLVGHSIHT